MPATLVGLQSSIARRASRFRPPIRLHVWFMLAALSVTAALSMVISSTNTYLATAFQDHNGQLEAISEHAERLQNFSRHIRKASLVGETESNLPFGGYIGTMAQLEPGNRLKLTEPGLSAHALEVVSARKINPTVGLSAASSRIDLVMVTGRIVGIESAPQVRFLVAVTPEKPVTAIDHQSL